MTTPITEQQARLLPTLINVLIAGMCDPPRLSRGRSYFRQGAVVDVDIQPGTLRGSVQGSRSVPYDATIRVSAAPPGAAVNALVPRASDVMFACTCPDWEAPCKHAIAVMAAFADMVGRDPQLLATWRGAPGAEPGQRAVVGSRAAGGTSSPSASNAPAEPDPITAEDRRALQDFLGSMTPFDPPSIVALRRPQADAWDDPWLTMLESALEALS